MKKMITSSLIIAIMGLLLPTSTMAKTDHTYIIGFGETVRLEISDAGRSILSWSTGKYAQWDVNPLYLEVVEYSWDHATVRGLRPTSLTVVQLTVTHNHDGIYGDKYYDAFHVKVLDNEATNIDHVATSTDDEIVEIYDIQGLCIYKGPQDNTPPLDEGLYMVKAGMITRKMYIK